MKDFPSYRLEPGGGRKLTACEDIQHGRIQDSKGIYSRSLVFLISLPFQVKYLLKRRVGKSWWFYTVTLVSSSEQVNLNNG